MEDSKSFIRSATQEQPKYSPFLLEPTFGYETPDGCPKLPSIREVTAEWLDAVNFIKDRTRFLIALNFCFHISTFFVFIAFVSHYMSVITILFAIITTCFTITIYNTLWYHRYCSDGSYTFSSLRYPRLFLWTSPLFIRESIYAIPHWTHHHRTDKLGDPYGPHLGWFGCYLSIDSSMKLNTHISERQYGTIVKMTEHIGFKVNSYAQFKKTGSVEHLGYYLVKTAFAQLFWSVPIYYLGGIPFLTAWFSAIFIATVMIRDFNWRGHGGLRQKKVPGWEFDTNSRALNQRFYGYLASEWHDNHHKYPMSANTALLPGQIDISFQIIKLMHVIGWVNSYIDARPLFRKEFSELSSANGISRL